MAAGGLRGAGAVVPDPRLRPVLRLIRHDEANLAYAHRSPDRGRLTGPVLFVNGDYDQVCTISGNRQGDPMRGVCPDLTITHLPAGHWLPLERKTELVQEIRAWLHDKSL